MHPKQQHSAGLAEHVVRGLGCSSWVEMQLDPTGWVGLDGLDWMGWTGWTRLDGFDWTRLDSTGFDWMDPTGPDWTRPDPELYVCV